MTAFIIIIVVVVVVIVVVIYSVVELFTEITSIVIMILSRATHFHITGIIAIIITIYSPQK